MSSPTSGPALPVPGDELIKPTPRARRAAVKKASPPRVTVGSSTEQLIPHEIPSAILGQKRQVIVYLPPGYRDDGQRYPVVYAQDGQNVFNPKTAAFGVDWALHTAANQAIAAGRLRPLVMVAIYNSRQRFDEYTPTTDPRHKGGRAELYLRFIMEELKPFIDSSYHTSATASDTGILGSSLGGLLALYAGWRHPHVFGAVAALSPSLWWAGRDLITAIGGVANHVPMSRLYVDMGTRESNDDHNNNGVPDVLDELRTLRAVLVYQGYRLGENLWYNEIPGAAHSESDWGARVGRVLETLFPLV